MLADEIKEYRKKQIITQQEMADLCGVSKITIMQIEKGKTNASVITEGKIRKVIGGYDNAGGN